MSERAPITNEQVGRDLGVTHSAISRIRSGKRHPSVTLMRRIEKTYGWKGDAQLRVFGSQTYAAEFEQCLTRHYAEKVSQ